MNMRGSGCSGGSFDYFEPIQATDGYDVIEAIAAQPWVRGNKVGMVGVSYSGISQLYVAADATAEPAGDHPAQRRRLLGAVHAVSRRHPQRRLRPRWALRARRRDGAVRPGVDAGDRIDDGDEMCRDNQLMRLQNPGLEEQIRDNPYYSDVAEKTDVRPLLGDIEVPVFLAGAWQDEQTGGHFANMLGGFTGTDHFYASLTNGLHTESLSAGIAPRWLEFLDLYVAKRVPSLDTLRTIAPVLGEAIWETDQITLRDDRFAGATLRRGAGRLRGRRPGRGAVRRRRRWRGPAGADAGVEPIVPVVAGPRRRGDGVVPRTRRHARQRHLDRARRSTSYVADPANVPEGYFDEADRRQHLVGRRRVRLGRRAAGHGGAASCPSRSPRDTIVMGSGSADLWITADAPDTDVEVTITEVRPDGAEVLVQSGWLRASHRALDEAASTALHPVQTHLEADAAPLARRRAGSDPCRHLSVRPPVPRRFATARRRSTLPAATARSGTGTRSATARR